MYFLMESIISMVAFLNQIHCNHNSKACKKSLTSSEMARIKTCTQPLALTNQRKVFPPIVVDTLPLVDADLYPRHRIITQSAAALCQ